MIKLYLIANFAAVYHFVVLQDKNASFCRAIMVV